MTVKVREIYPGRWYLVIDYHQFRKTAFVSTDKSKAEEAARRLQDALDLYGFDAILALDNSRRPIQQAPTLKAYAAKWIEELEHTDLAPSTQANYAIMLRKHVVPALGSYRLTEIDYAKLKAFAIEKSGTYRRDTVRLMIAATRALMAEAVRDRHIKANPVVGLSRFYRPAPRRKEGIDPFTIEELGRLEEKFRERFPDYVAFFLTLSRTGMRIGEAIALQWKDIDWEAGEILIRRSMPQDRHDAGGLKTSLSERRVDAIPRLLDELRAWQSVQRERAFMAGRELEAEDWIWSTAEGRPIYYSNFRRRVWNRVQQLAKVRQRTPHDLRHTWASQMLAAGADPAWISRQLGHSSPLTTLRIYAHWVPGRRRITSEVLDEHLVDKVRSDTQTIRKRNALGRGNE